MASKNDKKKSKALADALRKNLKKRKVK